MKILFSRPIPPELIERYRNEVEIDDPDHPLSPEELETRLQDADALFLVGTRADKALIDKGPKLKAVANFGVGYDNIDWEYCTEKKIAVVNTPTKVSEATAEHAVALIMCTIREVVAYDRGVRRGQWRGKPRPITNCGAQVYGSTLGIFGFGRIGKLVCKKAQGLGMNVIYYDVFRAPAEVEKEYGVTYMEFDEVLKNADCITLHMPYFAENHHLFNLDTFKKMKPTAFFVNCARGPIVDEKALYEALTTGIIQGAGIDVFENEPAIYEPLKELDNIVMTPHIASSTVQARTGMLHEAISGLVGVLKGEIPYNVVNKDVLK